MLGCSFLPWFLHLFVIDGNRNTKEFVGHCSILADTQVLVLVVPEYVVRGAKNLKVDAHLSGPL